MFERKVLGIIFQSNSYSVSHLVLEQTFFKLNYDTRKILSNLYISEITMYQSNTLKLSRITLYSILALRRFLMPLDFTV